MGVRDISRDYELMLEAIAGLMVIDAQGHLVYINDRCAEYIKVDKNKSLGKHISKVFPPSNMQELLKGDKKYNVNFYFIDGRMSASTQVQLRENDEIVGVLEYDLMEDIDELDDFLDIYSKALKDEISYFREQVRKFSSTKYSIDNIVGSSDKVKELKKQIEFAARTSSTVLIIGETGTGKEIVAHSVHNLSNRAFNDFVKVNSAGMAESLIESELFGYVDGAFTGARKGGKKGKFELADKGTLFIDEINQMPMSIQPKLLRALQEGEIAPVGSEEDIDVDVRIIAASNESLEKLVYDGKFRADLYYRLNVFPIVIPPLRERPEDIRELVNTRVKELNKELGCDITSIEEAVFEKLVKYDWPGNVRELFNRVEAAMNYAEGNTLKAEHFNFRVDNSKIDLEALMKTEKPIDAIKNEAERKLINEALMKFEYNKTKTAKYLKISRPLLYQKMDRLGIKSK